MKRYVQYGSGFYSADEWVNYDASPTLRFERIPLLGKLYVRNKQRFPDNVLYGDIVKGLPENENSCDGIFCSHVLEHLTLHDFRAAVKNSYRLLKPGGIFRGIVPDLRVSILNYLENYEMADSPAIKFMMDTRLGVEKTKSLTGKIKDLYGKSKHLWMWDFKSLKVELQRTGFSGIRECKYGDCADPHFILVEKQHRFNGAAAFECRK